MWKNKIGNYGSFFALLTPKNQKNQNFVKMKKIAGNIIIIHICTKNNNDIRYGFWDMEWVRHNFLSFWVIFCPLTPPNNPENQNDMCTKIKIIWCRLPEIWSETAIIFWHFGPFFLFYANDWPPKLKFGKNVKKVSGDIILLHMCTINEDHMMYSSWDIRHDGQSFWHFGPFDPPSNPKN